jgi:hypothetical protein
MGHLHGNGSGVILIRKIVRQDTLASCFIQARRSVSDYNKKIHLHEKLLSRSVVV